MILELSADLRIATNRYNWSLQRLKKSEWESFLFWPRLRHAHVALQKHLDGRSTLRGIGKRTLPLLRLKAIADICESIDAIQDDIKAIGDQLGRLDIHPAHRHENPELPRLDIPIDSELSLTVDRYSWSIKQPGNIPGCYWPRLTFALTWLMEHRLRMSEMSIDEIRAQINSVGGRIVGTLNPQSTAA